MLWCIANTPSSQLPLFFISHFLSPLLGPSFSIFATFGIPSVLLLVISDYLFNTYLWEREHHICFAFVICILFNVDVHHTGNTIYIPCLLIHTIILNKKMFFLWSWGLLIFYLMSGRTHLPSLLSFITPVNYKSNLRLYRACVFASLRHFTHSLLEWQRQNFLTPIISYKNMYIL